MISSKKILTIIILCGLLSACEKVTDNSHTSINEVLNNFFMESLRLSPESMTYLGIKDRYDEWDDISDEAKDQMLELRKKQLKQISSIDLTKASESEKLSVVMFKSQLEQQIAADKWRYHNYPVNQMRGKHSQIVSFLINQHSITDIADANDYVARVRNVTFVIDELINQLKIRAEKGIIIPKFVFPLVVASIDNVLAGQPFNEGTDSTILNDFKNKISTLKISNQEKHDLMIDINTALTSNFGPSYENLKDYLIQLEKISDDQHGVWKFPDGRQFYDFLLERTTTTKLNSDQIHELGLSEVSRIQNEMIEIMRKVNFDGSLKDFFVYLQNDEKFYYENTPQGKQAYIDKATQYINHMEEHLDKLFYVTPKAEMIVKAVEPFREASAGQAFYQRPAPDGSRPGVYFANLYDMKNMSKFNMQALAYHEGIPGHHMQISIAQELENIPKFRLYGGFTVFNEGWALYSEAIPKELGFYTDPFSDFGRLAGELYRACRLVVDTGIHAKKWSRERAIEYMNNNVPHSKNYNVRQIERYIVMPSQATAYKIGMIKIQELRELAESSLGDRFDIRGFHDVVLKNGSVTMPILESNVKKWIKNQ